MDTLKKLGKIFKELSLMRESKAIDELVNTGHIKIALLADHEISDGLQYHIDKNIAISDPIYRKFTSEYFSLLKEARELYNDGKLILATESEWILTEDCGKFGEFEGTIVPLDSPMAVCEEDSILKMAADYHGKSVQTNKPRTLRKGEPGFGRKQYVVYVKAPNGNIKRITFGDPNLKAKPEHAKNRKSFRARHKCDQKKDKLTPGYWACRYPPNW